MVTRMRACNSRTTFHYVLSIAGSISVFARKSNGSVVQFKWTDGSHYLTISGPALDRHHQLVVINLAWNKLWISRVCGQGGMCKEAAHMETCITSTVYVRQR